MARVGIRELKRRLSQYLSQVKQGEPVVVTERGAPIAVILPSAGGHSKEIMEGLARQGLGIWNGGKPRGARRPVTVRGKPLSETVLEDRR